MKRNLILLLSLFCALISMAQGTDAMLFGDVKAKETGEHLPHATITVKGTTLKTKCDASGHFKMTDLPVGNKLLLPTSRVTRNRKLRLKWSAARVLPSTLNWTRTL